MVNVNLPASTLSEKYYTNPKRASQSDMLSGRVVLAALAALGGLVRGEDAVSKRDGGHC